MKVQHFHEIKVKRFWFWPKVKVGFLFDQYAWHLLHWDKSLELEDVSKLKPSDLISLMLYNAAKSYFKEVGKKRWFNEKDVELWLENMKRKEFDDLAKVFYNSFAELSKSKEEVEGEVKKK